jgi:hypothetical protein
MTRRDMGMRNCYKVSTRGKGGARYAPLAAPCLHSTALPAPHITALHTYAHACARAPLSPQHRMRRIPLRAAENCDPKEEVYMSVLQRVCCCSLTEIILLHSVVGNPHPRCEGSSSHVRASHPPLKYLGPAVCVLLQCD